MIGNYIWSEIDIDVTTLNIEIQDTAKSLVDNYKDQISEADLLKMKGYADTNNNHIEAALALACLKYYNTLEDVNPAFIHSDMYGKKSTKPWWKFW